MPPIIPEDAPEFDPGVYHIEIKRCEQKTSNTSGAPMFEMTLKAIGFNDRGDLCTDYVSFSKKAAGLTAAKLGVFGFDVGYDVKSHELVGKRAYALIGHEVWGKKKSCKVTVSFKDDCQGGYWPDEKLPDSIRVVEPPASTPVDDTPF